MDSPSNTQYTILATGPINPRASRKPIPGGSSSVHIELQVERVVFLGDERTNSWGWHLLRIYTSNWGKTNGETMVKTGKIMNHHKHDLHMVSFPCLQLLVASDSIEGGISGKNSPRFVGHCQVPPEPLQTIETSHSNSPALLKISMQCKS